LRGEVGWIEVGDTIAEFGRRIICGVIIITMLLLDDERESLVRRAARPLR
jgi:hypothetical protein